MTNKTKAKLAVIFGEQAKKKIAAFEMCAAQVRECRCEKCEDFKRCVMRGAPCSTLARLIAWLNLEALQGIENDLQKIAIYKIGLAARAARMNEIERGAYAVVTITAYFPTKGSQKILARIYLEDDTRDERTLRRQIFNAYITGARKERKHGSK